MRHLTLFLVIGAIFALLTGNAAAVVTDIYSIRQGAHSIGDEVTVENVVVTASGLQGFFVQHPDEHITYGRAFSGIFVFTHTTHLGDVHMGDLVNVTGHYKEYYGLSEIDCEIGEPPCGTTINCNIEVVGTATVPDPVSFRIIDVNTAGPYAEAYEGVLVRVDSDDSTLFSNQPDYRNDWKLYTDFVAGAGAGDSIWVDLRSADPEGEFFYSVPDLGDEFTYVSGVLIYDWDEFRIAPRNCLLDLGRPCPPVLVGCWATSNSNVDVLFALDVDETSAETIDNYSFDSSLEVLSADRDDTDHSIVHLTTTAMSPGYIETIDVYDVLSEGELVVMPDGQFTFAQGITPIYDIQYTDDLLNDLSEFHDFVVTISGRVAHHYGNYYYLQEGDAGPFKHIYSRVTRLGDIARGDSLIVSGKIDDFFGETYLRYTPGVQYWENLGPATDPVVVTDLTANDLIYSSPPGGNPPDDNRAEAWEDALVHLIEPAYVDSVAGTAAIYGEWWMLVDPDSVRADFSEEYNDFGAEISYAPTVGDTIDIQGMNILVFNNFSIIPRDQNDITVIYSASGGVGNHVYDRVSLMLNNTPNPFGPTTKISFQLSHTANDVDIVIYDVNGAVVRNLLTDEPLLPGDHNFNWDGTNNRGLPVGSGTYFYKLNADDLSQAKQMIVLR